MFSKGERELIVLYGGFLAAQLVFEDRAIWSRDGDGYGRSLAVVQCDDAGLASL